MRILNSNNINFRGYDAIPLRGLYMQGLRKNGEINLFKEIQAIAKKENLDIFINQDNRSIPESFIKRARYNQQLSVWAQDNKAFVINKNGKNILWNTKESLMTRRNLGSLSDYEIEFRRYLPRGGNYYLGYNDKGEKWILVNSSTITDKNSFNTYGDIPTVEHLQEIFNVKKDNIFIIDAINDDLDEIVRPIGYPYILVNDYDLSLQNTEKMHKKYPKRFEVYKSIKNFIKKDVEDKLTIPSEKLCNLLSVYGFKPIKIGGRYTNDINYMNALAFTNKNNKISYITNSTNGSYEELEYLESLFENDLKEKVRNIDTVHFVTGGKRPKYSGSSNFLCLNNNFGLRKRNIIMDYLANRFGGIHCMVAEIPDFSKLKVKETADLII